MTCPSYASNNIGDETERGTIRCLYLTDLNDHIPITLGYLLGILD